MPKKILLTLAAVNASDLYFVKRMSENKMSKKMLGSKKNEVNGQLRILHNNELLRFTRATGNFTIETIEGCKFSKCVAVW
jgi:hypothetical protein